MSEMGRYFYFQEVHTFSTLERLFNLFLSNKFLLAFLIFMNYYHVCTLSLS